jgi:hypothetical protein
MESPHEIKKINTRVSRSQTKFSEQVSTLEDPEEIHSEKSAESGEKKKDKKLVFLSRSVL